MLLIPKASPSESPRHEYFQCYMCVCASLYIYIERERERYIYNICAYMYMYMYIYIYMYMYVCIYIYIYTHAPRIAICSASGRLFRALRQGLAGSIGTTQRITCALFLTLAYS